MTKYLAAVESRTHAFLLERRIKNEGIDCELAYLPREISTGLCNMGVKFSEDEKWNAITCIRRSGLPGCRIYKETVTPRGSIYTQEYI